MIGNRIPEALATAHDIDVSIGTSSVGTHGKSALPKKYVILEKEPCQPFLKQINQQTQKLQTE
ncbi:hypothetical protein MD537_02800 [Flavihumibacter sediminis]|nr:hypothetical protein [Flavihumibacter sediminis]